MGAEVIEIPTIEIKPPRSYKALDTALRNIGNYDWLILTSVNGVEALFARIKKLRIAPGKLKHLQVAAIGPATQREIEEHGLRVAVTPEKYVAESVVEALKGKTEGKRVLLVRAKVARDVLPTELRKAGAKVDVAEAYETHVPAGAKAKLNGYFPMTRPARTSSRLPVLHGNKFLRAAGERPLPRPARDMAGLHRPGHQRHAASGRLQTQH